MKVRLSSPSCVILTRLLYFSLYVYIFFCCNVYVFLFMYLFNFCWRIKLTMFNELHQNLIVRIEMKYM